LHPYQRKLVHIIGTTYTGTDSSRLLHILLEGELQIFGILIESNQTRSREWHDCSGSPYTRNNAQIVTSLQTSCNKSANKLLQICSQAVNKLCSHCLFPVVVTSLEQAVNNLWQPWRHYQTCSKVVLTSLIQSWYNKNVTRLMTQGGISYIYCYIMTVSDLLEQPCNKSDNINKVVTSC
jgi:hypothetical protein